MFMSTLCPVASRVPPFYTLAGVALQRLMSCPPLDSTESSRVGMHYHPSSACFYSHNTKLLLSAKSTPKGYVYTLFGLDCYTQVFFDHLRDVHVNALTDMLNHFGNRNVLNHFEVADSACQSLHI